MNTTVRYLATLALGFLLGISVVSTGDPTQLTYHDVSTMYEYNGDRPSIVTWTAPGIEVDFGGCHPDGGYCELYYKATDGSGLAEDSLRVVNQNTDWSKD